MFHYTYRITNTVDKMHYYGTRTCNVDPQYDIGTVYFSSSTNREFILDQKENPQKFKYKILKCFESREAALAHEIMLHNKFDVKNHPAFYNKANQSSTGFTVNKEVGLAISKALKGKTSNKKGLTWEELYSPEVIENMKNALRYERTQETRDKLSVAHTGKQLSPQHKNAIGLAQVGKTYSPETCEKIRQRQLENHVLRGMTYNEYYGDRANEIKTKMSNTRTGKAKPMTTEGKTSVQNSNTVNKTRVYHLVYVNGEECHYTLQQIQKHFNISVDLAKRLTRFEKPNNKSKYANIYNTLVSVVDVGVLKDFTLPQQQ